MTDNSKDPLIIGGVELGCRLFTGTGKYGDDALIPDIIAASGCEVVTVALRRVDLGNPNDNILSHIPAGVRLLPNTSGARDADEAVRIARLARAAGCGDWSFPTRVIFCRTATLRPAPRKFWQRRASPYCPISTPICMSPGISSTRARPPSCLWARP